ncbi:hypothetical protein C8P64_1957 [Christiangramia gaetbulicola]|uniref:HIRAN domain-containing protein n=1 Tax=Christiangramia gaetbulicola TaxID=703340 RepID=A0A2T6AHX7_9FLAO|nr:HIRAN domain-containing protein [Christiangramia gaetbulicola]PTX43430.1 hypothetical protein C8P64_1957 [Christiangramia gaetbulicola]
MKRVGNIFLIWRKGPGSRRIPVAIIKRNSSEGTKFKYIQENLKEAENKGFIPYTGFPDTEKVYKENVLEILSQRLVKSERNDLSSFYKFWRIDPEKKTDKYYMLAMTQGLLPIDNFEFLADFNPKKGLNFISEIAGLTRTKIESDFLEKGDILKYVLDPKNEQDKNAVKLFKDEKFLGYVKKIHSRVFHKAKGPIKVKVHHLERNGVITRAFIEILL